MLGIALYILSAGTAVEPFFSGKRAMYISGFAIVVLLAAISFIWEIFFDGVVDARSKKWPRVIFLILLVATVTVIGFSTWHRTGTAPDFIKLFFPTFAISALLLWYGSTALFSSFFLGKGAAVFMNNPAAWLFGARNDR